MIRRLLEVPTGPAGRSGVIAAAGSAAAAQILRSWPPGGPQVWARRNHRDEPVTLLGGPAYVAGAVLGVLLAPRLGGATRSAALMACSAAGALGAYDDLAGSGASRGLGGHLKALLRGELSTGVVKIAGLGLTGLLAASLLAGGDSRRSPSASRAARTGDVAVSAALIAGTANLINLLDLRPGRARKTVAALGVLTMSAGGPGASLAGAAVGAAVAGLPGDLAEQTMLGDAGANAAGALLGVALAARLPRGGRRAVLAGIVALTLASERVSFSAVIDRTPALRYLDQLGRRPLVPVP